MKENQKKKNKLFYTSSPYLKQHQYNPVDWYPWSDEALEKAKSENKLIIVSIGYSTCHWCHVMERESFEDQSVADVMNANFISIKIDREENPDLDQIYMTAVQLMSGQGGWPLNCICLPDGRPIYGGTYFPKETWLNILEQLQELWLKNPTSARDYAEKLASGIAQSERLPVQQQIPDFHIDQLTDIVQPWTQRFDSIWGGSGEAPKFPMPDNWDFLLQFGHLHADSQIIEQVHLTLQKIASGGIYDQIGGGFSRYSVDKKWHIPHFEKMLYDNAQLVCLFSDAWLQKPLDLYQNVVHETLTWCMREMKGTNGGYFSALDADTEGVEGKFYSFQAEELEKIFESSSEISDLKKYYNIEEKGNWTEEKTNILYVKTDESAPTFLKEAKRKILEYRNQRVRPSLDNKQLCSWNAMMLKAFAKSYSVFENTEYLDEALRILSFFEEELEQKDGSLLRKPLQNDPPIPGFLEDYAQYASALLTLYSVTFEEKHVYKAKKITDYVLENFLDEEKTFFYFTHKNAPILIARKQETQDNVIPSSNSVMMQVLDTLGLYFDHQFYTEISTRALASMLPQLSKYGSAYSNWAKLLLRKVYGTQEIILSGPEIKTWKKEISKYYLPLSYLLGSDTESQLPILKNKTSSQHVAYVCQNKTCSLPVKTHKELLLLLNIK